MQRLSTTSLSTKFLKPIVSPTWKNICSISSSMSPLLSVSHCLLHYQVTTTQCLLYAFNLSHQPATGKLIACSLSVYSLAICCQIKTTFWLCIESPSFIAEISTAVVIQLGALLHKYPVVARPRHSSHCLALASLYRANEKLGSPLGQRNWIS